APSARRPSRRVESIVSSASPSAGTATSLPSRTTSTRSTSARSGTSDPSSDADQRTSPEMASCTSVAGSSGSASATVEKYGPGYNARPSSSNNTASSRKPSPAPPASSGTDTPIQPSSASSFHEPGSQPSSESASSATRSNG